MVKNKIGGSKSKNISSKVSKKKITADDPDFENSFFAIVITKPNGLMCNVRICPNDKVKKLFESKKITTEMQVNIGKLKHDKRNYTISQGDIVQIEINFDMKRQNGNLFGCILCKYDDKEIKFFRKKNMLFLDDIQDNNNEIDFSDDEFDNNIEINLDEHKSNELSNEELSENKNIEEDIDIDDL
jgi:hypothetical protein